jgi:two-component system, sensor histidine kinase and response regulator
MSQQFDNTLDIKNIMDLETVLNNLGGDKELFVELATIFSEESFDQIKQIRDSIARGDLQSAAMVSHTLKGAVGNFAAKPAYYAAAQVEKMSRDGQLNEIADAVDVLEVEVNRLNSALERLVKEL